MNEVVNDMNVETQQKLNKLREIGISNVEELTTALQKEDIHFSPTEFSALGRTITTTFEKNNNIFPIPEWLATVFSTLVQGRTANTICDPYARIGLLIGIMQETTKAKSTIAFTPMDFEAIIGKVLVDNAEWRVGNSINLLSALDKKLDIAACILPWGLNTQKKLKIGTFDGYEVELDNDLGQQILILTSMNLSTDGIGLFVVNPSFFFSPHSVFLQFSTLGLGLEAALELPPGTFAPITNIPSYLVIVRKHPVSKMFVAQLSSDSSTNFQILSNLKNGKDGSLLELGRFVDVQSFKGLDAIRVQERFEKFKTQFGAPDLPLGELATINIGRYGNDFQFPKQENSIFIPLIGTSNVVDSLDNITLKPQNYAQAVIDPSRANARFVSQFLNSEFGKEIIEHQKSRAVIPKLNKQTLKELRVFVPDLYTQKTVLDIEARITAEQNTLLGLQSELEQLRRDLWTKIQSADDVDQHLSTFSKQLTCTKEHSAVSLDKWFETLPFPLSSILRAWQATPSSDFKTKYDHLLNFFEAVAEFLSLILLSAFESNQALFESHSQKLSESMKESKLSFQKATFGTWKLVVEYLGKQTRKLLKDGQEDRKLCMEMFADPSLCLPKIISSLEIANILSITNKKRNDWKGHSGIVGQEEAKLRNEQLLGEVQKLRDIMAGVWDEIELIRLINCVPRSGVFENEVAVLMGSNSEFLKETRRMHTLLDADYLYLSKKGSDKVLKLLPLIQVGPSPSSAKNACYFYSRAEKDGLRFVSYHFVDQPERKFSSDTNMSVSLRNLLEAQ